MKLRPESGIAFLGIEDFLAYSPEMPRSCHVIKSSGIDGGLSAEFQAGFAGAVTAASMEAVQHRTERAGTCRDTPAATGRCAA